jgi:hypothetical protein
MACNNATTAAFLVNTAVRKQAAYMQHSIILWNGVIV